MNRIELIMYPAKCTGSIEPTCNDTDAGRRDGSGLA